MIIAANALIRRSGHNRGLGSIWNEMKLARAKRRAYTKTIKSLSSLSDRDLKDLGIARCQIAGKAFDCVYETSRRA
ncbi:DUF1127 domain-containing protein [Roseovarius sp. ZX-A-9]|uniref:DUF1127 domain-containing protein n=1 Tax=Roseovarius sp. ZX-A-9 TaxID=3014783 RepID=UPI0023308A45|nr:DUF1127 domain-containing protein [Roseovarius sp. ZX-A-9]